MVPITYVSEWMSERGMDDGGAFDVLWNELDWQKRDFTPRREYYCNEAGTPYAYGHGEFARTYEAQPWHPVIRQIQKWLELSAGCRFEVCFLNGYRDGSDSLGWHADDSPEMDDERPIGIVSLGASREIYFCPQSDKKQVTKLWLASGSLCLMAAGMQLTHYHRIPKSSIHGCGPRISLTFRGLNHAS